MKSKEDYKKVSCKIRLFFAAVVIMMFVCAVMLKLTFEGALIDSIDGQTMYLIEVGMFFCSGLCILLALKFYDRLWLRRVSGVKEEEKASTYFVMYMIRLALLAVPMLTGIFFYYGLLENWGLYYALAGLVSSFFCLPSAEGVEIEMKMAESFNS